MVQSIEKNFEGFINNRKVLNARSLDLLLTYELDDIKVKYHPHSELPPTVHHFSDFSCSCSSEDQVPRNNSPWEPFRTRLDFEVAEIALEAAMTEEQTNRLLDLIHRSASGKDIFTLQSHDEVRLLWEMASERYTPDVVSVKHQDETHEFDMHYRPLWDWALDLLRDRRLAPHFVFDAQHLSKFNGEWFVRFIDELWTANAFWNAQSQLPSDAKPLAFILYADKSKLSSFGTEKGYPIIARIANPPVHIRNGNTALGGGRVIGWLPIVPEDQKHTKKKSFVDFKNAVWHNSFYQLLQSIELHSKTGYWFECGDQIRHRLWPLILILSGDYEEQCVMALICGVKGKFPCSVCLVPQDEQSVNRVFVLRTSCNSQQVLCTVSGKHTEKEKEEALKAYSVRNVENIFWKFFLADVHRALSIDCLHMNHEGLWGDHFFDALPRWLNLTHFKTVMSVDFNDGSLHEDISKLVLFTAQDILRQSQSKLGYLLLHCICYYIEFDIYASFEVHTEETIVAGRAALNKFSDLMEEYIPESQPETSKNWNFPKKHMIMHIFDDILAKGVTHNYNTKPNEKMHGGLRKIYLRRTNFKDVAPQILRYDHWLLTSTSMRTELDELDNYSQNATDDPETNETLDELLVDPIVHVHLGSKQGRHSFSDIMDAHGTDRAFTDFRTKLHVFLNVFLLQNGIPLPDGPGRALHLQADDDIIEFRFLQVNYESMVDWCLHRDLLRCSPKFYGSPRFNCVISCSIGDTDLALALIHPYDVGIGVRRRQDVDLGLWRVRAKPRSSSEIISVRSIIRGAALARDPETDGDHLVIHTIDAGHVLDHQNSPFLQDTGITAIPDPIAVNGCVLATPSI
ncbi:uncharacterized protein F5891DRAFT_1124360 [Suillus fuscotomentosus]|uniref:Uncharacterized protein n=1 Tax=Suillus fuscotomentosus TaxID=1912939 RepID=A0AAD4HU74_9AGAM|nr:uncharacterized protein F5891DRAFT_1124360 [Suillus fuscotomentosus]KAG1908652.1 hypothetical protein F5891DRAFT_1124360 [Suillus fuscotomentosus]